TVRGLGYLLQISYLKYYTYSQLTQLIHLLGYLLFPEPLLTQPTVACGIIIIIIVLVFIEIAPLTFCRLFLYQLLVKISNLFAGIMVLEHGNTTLLVRAVETVKV